MTDVATATATAIAIAVAMPIEARGLRRRAVRSRRLEGWRHGWTLELPGGSRCAIVAGGQGAAAAVATTQRLVRDVRPRALLVAGLAGGAASDLRAGECVVIDQARWADSRVDPVASDPGLVQAMRAGFGAGARVGTAIQVPAVADPAVKRALGVRGAAVVDLESADAFRAAHDAACPVVGLRVVLDPAYRAVPRTLQALGGLQGGPWFPAVLGVWRAPFEAIAMLRFGAALRTALDALAEGMAQSVAAIDREQAG